MTDQIYPGVTDRIKAVVVDSITIVAFIIMTTIVFSFFEDVPDKVRMFAFIFIFFLYDPIFTTVFGGTIGHFAFGLRVKRSNNQKKKIIFPFAIIRFLIKACLGWISLLTVTANSKGKAIHDMVVGSVIVYAKQTDIPEEELINETEF